MKLLWKLHKMSKKGRSVKTNSSSFYLFFYIIQPIQSYLKSLIIHLQATICGDHISHQIRRLINIFIHTQYEGNLSLYRYEGHNDK